ncbi:MAG TPA: hypothetical protein PLL54_03400 [Dermatophilaceae bacterium]|jgi:hypothetical protein|nr:hypothetical protein [Dermatophilaceae bacterium]
MARRMAATVIVIVGVIGWGSAATQARTPDASVAIYWPDHTGSAGAGHTGKIYWPDLAGR